MSDRTTEKRVEIGTGDSVVIDKAFGPTIFADLRITASGVDGWVIERRWIPTGVWLEWVTIPAQLDQEFSDDEP